MPQESTSSEASPGTRIIYCFIIHICLRWNIYMHMDISLVRFIRVAGGTFRRWIYQDNPPRLPPDIQMIDMFFKPASHWPASRALWAIRALIGRYAEGGTGVNLFLHLNLVSISFDYWQNINKKRFKKRLHIICICAAYITWLDWQLCLPCSMNEYESTPNFGMVKSFVIWN